MYDMLIAMSALGLAIVLGISLAITNLRDTARIESNLAARREFKREKNKRLAKFYGIKLDD